jgi:creatinine amidohydrolase
MPVFDLLSLQWPVLDRMDRTRAVAILPVGAIEAHGPHLPLGTDVIIAAAMARAGAARLAARGVDVLMLPALPFAPAPFAAAFAGTIDTPAEATTQMVAGVARSLARHGVRLIALANAHHDPAHVRALRSAVEAVSADRSATIVFPDLTRRRWAERLTGEFTSGACHAGRYEGSIVLAEQPGQVDRAAMARLVPNPRSLVDAIREGCDTFASAGGPDAYFGFPAEATAEEGIATVDILGQILEDAVMEKLEVQSSKFKVQKDK